jgi:hypothetical protein
MPWSRDHAPRAARTVHSFLKFSVSHPAGGFVKVPGMLPSPASLPISRRCLLAAAMIIGTGRRLSAATDEESNPLLQWNEGFLRWVRAQSPPPALTARNLAMLHLALWRTASKTKASGLSPALHTAAHEVCATLFPSHQAEMTRLSAAAGASGSAAEAARRIAREVMDSRAADGSSTTVHYVPKEAPGQWRRTPPAMRPPELPHWGKVTPILLKSADQFRPTAPPDISSEAFARELDTVRELGGKVSAKRTTAETETAHFWSDFSYTTSPPGHWNDIARQLAARLRVKESARLFALLNLAMADAGIACWDCKYHYNYWRPVTALRHAGEKDWLPLLNTPPHPDYVSGHSAFSGAAVAVLHHFFGTDKLTFTADSDTVKNVTRCYTGIQACADEISRSRVLGGIHLSSACREGLALGRKVGEWTVVNFHRL